MEQTIQTALASQGPAWALVTITLLALWRFSVWLKPHMESIVASHIAFITHLSTKLDEISTTQKLMQTDIKELRSDLNIPRHPVSPT